MYKIPKYDVEQYDTLDSYLKSKGACFKLEKKHNIVTRAFQISQETGKETLFFGDQNNVETYFHTNVLDRIYSEFFDKVS